MASSLQKVLETLYKSYTAEYINSDPIFYVHQFSDRRDQEVTGFISSALAFGSVPHIKRSLEDILKRMNGQPYKYIRNYHPSRAKEDFRNFVHRFVRGKDIACFLYYISQVYEQYGSIYACFMEGHSTGADTITRGLSEFIRRMLTLDCTPFFPKGELPPDAKVRYLLCSPEKGSACKRMNMFLRWMVRRGDGIDLGLWKEISPAQLVMPLDTHVSRISRNLDLTKYNNTNWKMAVDVTRALRTFDSADPVKYDFAFSRLGILGICTARHRKSAQCPLNGLCNCIENA